MACICVRVCSFVCALTVSVPGCGNQCFKRDPDQRPSARQLLSHHFLDPAQDPSMFTRPSTHASTRPSTGFEQHFSNGQGSGEAAHAPLSLEESMDTGSGAPPTAPRPRPSRQLSPSRGRLRLQPADEEVPLVGEGLLTPAVDSPTARSHPHAAVLSSHQASVSHGSLRSDTARRRHRASVTSHHGGWDSVSTLPEPEMPTWARESHQGVCSCGRGCACGCAHACVLERVRLTLKCLCVCVFVCLCCRLCALTGSNPCQTLYLHTL